MSDEVKITWPADELFRENLAALADRDTDLAQLLQNTPIPQGIQLAPTRDGSVNYRLDEKTWLGFSSLPTVSAAANAERVHADAGNLAMRAIGHGLEAQLILQKLARHQALFVHEPQPLHLALALRLRDFSADLRAGRLILLTGPEPAAALVRFYQAHPGYNAITQGVAWPWLTDQENHAHMQPVTAAMDQVVAQTVTALQEVHRQLAAADRDRSWDELKALLVAWAACPSSSDCDFPSSNPQSTIRNPQSLVAINFGSLPTIEHHCLARDLLAGLAALGARTDFQAAFPPDAVSPLAQARRLAEIRPHLLLLADTLRGDAGHLPEKTLCLTLLTPASKLPAEPGKLGKFDAILAATAEQQTQLVETGFPTQRVLLQQPLVNPDLFRPVDLAPADRARFAADALIIADRFPTDPEAYEIKLPTHKQLWAEVVRLIEDRPEACRADRAADYLARAQACGIELREEALRDYFARLIRECLIPSLLLDGYGRALTQAGCRLKVFSLSLDPARDSRAATAWRDSPLAAHFAGCLTPGAELNAALNAAPILICLNPEGRLERPLLEAAAAGALILARRLPGTPPPASLTEGAEFTTFDTPRDLVSKVRQYQNASRRTSITAKARVRVLRDHPARVQTLLAHLAQTL